MGENELLLRHAENWAAAKERPLDRHLLEAVLEAWARHEAQSVQRWPTGSAESLLLHHLPAERPLEDSEAGALVQSLETFWRFLRSTGRMRSGSADPRDLVKEAQRVAPAMATVPPECARTTTVEEALTEWSAHVRDEDWDDEEFDDEGEDYLDQLKDELKHEETWALLPCVEDWAQDLSLESSAAEARRAPFVLECLRFAQWVGEGRGVTGGVLCPAQIQEASRRFGLVDWEREFLAHSPLREPGGELSPALRHLQPDAELGSLDHLVAHRALRSLWYACEAGGLIAIHSTTVCATPAADAHYLRSDDDWVDLALTAAVAAVQERLFLEPVDPLLRVIFPFLAAEGDRVELPDVQGWWWEHDASPWASLELTPAQARLASDRQVERQLWALEDTGLWRRDGQTLHRTALGMDMATLSADDPTQFFGV